MKRKMKMGMIGGGPGAFIGAVHRMAAVLDGQIELVCGAFSQTPEKSKAMTESLYLDPKRVYNNFQEMIDREKLLPIDERMDFVSIVTPNHMHFLPAKLALESGFSVICDKPVTLNSQEAEELAALSTRKNLTFALTHNYTGYPMVKEARSLIRNGALGKIRKIVVEYPQGWLAGPLEKVGQKQAGWRTNPKEAGISCCMGDIGSHAENLCEYITGLKISALCADLTTFIDGRLLDDDGNVLVRFNNGAKGVLYASQVSVGEENNLMIRVYGEKGGIEWHQQEPNTLLLKKAEGHTQIIRTGVGPLSAEAQMHTRLPPGHPEGYLEAFANLYRNFAAVLQAKEMGVATDERMDFPTIQDGIRGMKFIEAVVKSSQSEQKWVSL